jgi:hypothetical protein
MGSRSAMSSRMLRAQASASHASMTVSVGRPCRKPPFPSKTPHRSQGDRTKNAFPWKRSATPSLAPGPSLSIANTCIPSHGARSSSNAAYPPHLAALSGLTPVLSPGFAIARVPLFRLRKRPPLPLPASFRIPQPTALLCPDARHRRRQTPASANTSNTFRRRLPCSCE